MSAESDYNKLLEHVDMIEKRLKSNNVPRTTFNVLYSIYSSDEHGGTLGDWLGGDSIRPECLYETRWQAFKRWFRKVIK